ncbi:hypothetical protein FTUN_0805 [Frigoriglobus tundricola]|uniref:Uncharacterized protein n=1 Tax=Frigoriglobus tundricola TaxID=2774151 RepID=A0A6M5YGW9_9BACT|nr:hypothetical protein FTUN_0805 [Frigoriglobus tundricola]
MRDTKKTEEPELANTKETKITEVRSRLVGAVVLAFYVPSGRLSL